MSRDCYIAAMAARFPRGKVRLKIPPCVRKNTFTARRSCISRPLPRIWSKRAKWSFSTRDRRLPLSRALRGFRNLTIITNAVNIAAELSNTAVDVILTGGTLRKNSFSLVGPIAEETLRHLNADVLFLGVDGFDVHYGLSTPNLLESKVNRVMLEVSRHRIAVCDSSKFGRRSLSLIGPTSSLHGVITDHAIPKSDLSALKKSGIEVTLV